MDMSNFTEFELYKLILCVGLAQKEMQIRLLNHDIWLSGGTPKDTSINWGMFDRAETTDALSTLSGIELKLKSYYEERFGKSIG
jgi:hypothetical protein